MADTNSPNDRFYSEKHEWAKDENGIVSVGITDYAGLALGDIVFIEVPKVGKKVKKGDSLGAIESVKAAEEIYSPVSGEIIEGNTIVSKDPSLANTKPFETWICKIKSDDSKELSALMNSEKYK